MGQMTACYGFVHRAVLERHAGWPESSEMRIQIEDSGIVHEDSERERDDIVSIVRACIVTVVRPVRKAVGSQVCERLFEFRVRVSLSALVGTASQKHGAERKKGWSFQMLCAAPCKSRAA